jgi:hypothetical protein
MNEHLKIINEDHKFIKEKKVNHLFILNNYGKCYSFINELLQTQPITKEEFTKINQIRERKGKWETYTCHVFTLATTLGYIKHFFKVNNNIYKAFLIVIYPLFVFNITYNFGRHLGGFLIMRSKNKNFYLENINELLGMKDSIQGLQTRLFVKSCLMDELLIKENLKKPEPLTQSFIFDQTIGSTFGRLIRIKNKTVNLINKYI